MIFEYLPITKASQTASKRRTPKRVNKGKFSRTTLKIIGERDEWRCVRCGSYKIESTPHHVIYKSQGGTGTADNGVSICRTCHDWAHSCKEGRKWFEDYRTRNLLGG